jgi:hypothetical protein
MLQEFRNRTADQGLTSLVTLIDASMRSEDPIISDLHGVVSRALDIAKPDMAAAGRLVCVTTHVSARTGVKNCGSALECLLAALLVDLAHGRVSNLRLYADVARGSLEIEIEGDGPRPPVGSWRFLLACDLAARLGATIVSPPETASYVVRFR